MSIAPLWRPLAGLEAIATLRSCTKNTPSVSASLARDEIGVFVEETLFGSADSVDAHGETYRHLLAQLVMYHAARAGGWSPMEFGNVWLGSPGHACFVGADGGESLVGERRNALRELFEWLLDVCPEAVSNNFDTIPLWVRHALFENLPLDTERVLAQDDSFFQQVLRMHSREYLSAYQNVRCDLPVLTVCPKIVKLIFSRTVWTEKASLSSRETTRLGFRQRFASGFAISETTRPIPRNC